MQLCEEVRRIDCLGRTDPDDVMGGMNPVILAPTKDLPRKNTPTSPEFLPSTQVELWADSTDVPESFDLLVTAGAGDAEVGIAQAAQDLGRRHPNDEKCKRIYRVNHKKTATQKASIRQGIDA